MRRIVARCIFPGIYVGFHDLSLVEGRADETEEMGLQRTFSTSFPFCILSEGGKPRLHCWPLRDGGEPLLRTSILIYISGW